MTDTDQYPLDEKQTGQRYAHLTSSRKQCKYSYFGQGLGSKADTDARITCFLAKCHLIKGHIRVLSKRIKRVYGLNVRMQNIVKKR